MNTVSPICTALLPGEREFFLTAIFTLIWLIASPKQRR